MTTLKMPRGGLFDSQGRLTAAGQHYLAALEEVFNRPVGEGTGGGFAVFDEPAFIELPDDGVYPLAIDRSFAGRIDRVTTRCLSGSCQLQMKINETPLGGSANAVTTTKQSREPTSANEFQAGDDWVAQVSFNAACRGLSLAIAYTRTS